MGIIGILIMILMATGGHEVEYWLIHYATSRKVTGSSPDEVVFLNLPNHSTCTMAPRSTQPLNRNEYQESSWEVKGGQRVRLTTLLPSVSQISRENVGASTSHNPTGLHGLLQTWLYLFY
jgi:hypothetical protein